MAGAQISTSVTIIDSLHGFMGLSLTEYSTSAEAAIAAGSVVEIAGAMFTFASDEAINASSWTAITTATTAYIALTPSGTAGSQVVTATYTATAPTWRDDLQGWYASAASSTRVIGTVYKAEATSYYPKYLYGNMQEGKQQAISVNVASVASSLSVGGGVSIASSLSVANVFAPAHGVAVAGYINSASITLGSIYTALDTFIPSTGMSILLHGAMAADHRVLTRAYRVSSTTITLYGAEVDIDGLLYTNTISASVATPILNVSIAW